MKPNTEAEFWSKVWKTGHCWRWLGRGKKFMYEGKHEYVNRLAWAFINGPIPYGRNLVPQCETKFCINPDHWAPSGVVTEMMIRKFWSRVDKRGRTVSSELGHCWEWTGGGQAEDGYGTIAWGDRVELTHRVSWFLVHGAFPNLCLLHKCDNRRCIREDHLFEGTIADNNRDKVAKGRQRRGETHQNARITEQDVIDIRREYAEGKLLRGLSERFGLSLKSVWAIATGKKWKHVAIVTAAVDIQVPMCKASGCPRQARKRFLCTRHYQQYKLHGLPLPPSQHSVASRIYYSRHK